MSRTASMTSLLVLTAFWLPPSATALAQAPRAAANNQLRGMLQEFQSQLDSFNKQDQRSQRDLADVAVYAKAVEWILRHEEFFKPDYEKQALRALETGLARAADLANGKQPWNGKAGTVILGYRSRVDESIQPYALALPADFDPQAARRWPLHVKLHGRAGQMNEVNFIQRFDNKPPAKDQNWIQLDVFGRTNNAYRWAGETDVFEAIADVRRRVRIDRLRVTLHGFSMGGAGAWHLGLHHPSRWSSVGPGAGFVDFYKYQDQTTRLPEYQHRTLGIYDSIDYALNAFNVPVCTYGGELDKQLIASTSMVEAAKPLNVPIKLLIGPGMGHKFHPDSFREFMDFHLQQSQQGRRPYPGNREIRFVTRTLKYNECEWLKIEALQHQYRPAIVESKFDADRGLLITTRNVALLQIARDLSDSVTIDGTPLPLASAADGLLPGVYYEQNGDKWVAWEYDESKRYETFADSDELVKRHDLQGPIDDAFMQPFVCVRGTGKPASAAHQAWADWSLNRFAREFDKWMRGKVIIVDDVDVTPEMIRRKNLILFGDPQSNSVIAKLQEKLPVSWSGSSFRIGGQAYDMADHGLSLIYPNPLNGARYVVLNSGHTFHEKDFKASNSWLFPRLGDVAVQKFETDDRGNYSESIVWAEIFNGGWRLPESR